jgi:GNAT superfamily N-acetyltransferase
MNNIEFKLDKRLDISKVIDLYSILNWSAAKKPEELKIALENSDTVITAWDKDKLVGLGNAISDKALVVYYPHLAVHPDYQKQGIGKAIIQRMKKIYGKLHQQQIVADATAINFYKKCGFVESGNCKALWIYKGTDHD